MPENDQILQLLSGLGVEYNPIMASLIARDDDLSFMLYIASFWLINRGCIFKPWLLKKTSSLPILQLITNHEGHSPTNSLKENHLSRSCQPYNLTLFQIHDNNILKDIALTNSTIIDPGQITDHSVSYVASLRTWSSLVITYLMWTIKGHMHQPH